MTAGVGHNNGPTMEKGRAWRKHSWTRARNALLPQLPLEVVRRRVRRAKELGLDYKAYASIRAASGHDVVALLFSSNALELLRAGDRIPAPVAAKLDAVRHAGRLALIHRPLDPADVLSTEKTLDDCTEAPGLRHNWPEARDRIKGFLSRSGLPADRVVLVSETALEREWLSAGGLAGNVHAASYFERSAP